MHPTHRRLVLLASWLGAALAGCRAPDPTGHQSTWADVACQDLPDEPVLAPFSVLGPEPLLPGYTAYLSWLQFSPNRADRDQPVTTNVDDITVFAGNLYTGLGDWSFNTGSLYCYEQAGRCEHEDAPGHGMPLLSWAPGAEDYTATILEEEEIQRFRRTGSSLFVLSTDPTRGDPAPACARSDAGFPCPEERFREHPRYLLGNVHQLRSGEGVLQSEATLDDALHVFDVAPLDGVLWAIGSAEPGRPEGSTDPYESHAAVWRSKDDGAQWWLHWSDDIAGGNRRLDALLPLGDRLFVFGHNNRARGTIGLRYEISAGGDIAPMPALLPSLRGVVRTDVLDAETGLAWSARHGDAVVLQADGDTLRTWPLDLDMALIDTWLLCSGDMLLLGIARNLGARTAVVYRTSDLHSFTEVFRWKQPMGESLTALAWWNDGLVVGTGDDRLLYAPLQGRER